MPTIAFHFTLLQIRTINFRFSSMSSLPSVDLLKKNFLLGVRSIQPQQVIKKWLRREEDSLYIGDRKYPLTSTYVVGFGKAVAGMIPHIENVFGKSNDTFLRGGVISVPNGFKDSQVYKSLGLSANSKIELCEGAKSNLPDEDAQNTTLKIISLVKKLSSNDLLIVLISGGGSALLCLPTPPLTLAEKSQLIRNLSESGASITEINIVRKALSQIKGGKLAQMTKAKIVSFIISDIVNNPIDMIASGPTVLQTDLLQNENCTPLEILDKYEIPLTENLKKVLNTEQPKITTNDLSRVNNIIIGDNMTALESIKQCFLKHDIIPIILSSSIQGNATTIGKELETLAYTVLLTLWDQCDNALILSNLQKFITHAKVEELDEAIKMAKTNNKGPTKPIVLIIGGETTVEVRGNGIGGRNQEMVLSGSLELEKLCEEESLKGEITFLSAGTDGMDGPTDAAGAYTYYRNKNGEIRNQVLEAREEGLAPENYLQNNNSYEYFSKLSNGKYLIKTGHTGTNVMDVHLLYIEG